MSWPAFWKKRNWQSRLLWPLSQLVCWEAARRLKKFEATQQEHSNDSKQSLIVVGNVVVGGSGKTPFILWLVESFKRQGISVGILSRGYGANNAHWPKLVSAQTSVMEVGDEPYMLAKQTGCPVAVSPKRAEALALLNEQYACDVVISDDGLQHYGLARDIEIVLIDAERGFGNGWCLPAGPLREPLQRIAKVDFTVWNGLDENQAIPELAVEQKNAYAMQLQPIGFRQVGNPQKWLSIEEFVEQYHEVIAIAGIGNPQRFFNSLESLGLTVEAKSFADHYAYQKQDFDQLLGLASKSLKQDQSALSIKPLLMTEKDAVKCQTFAQDECHWWYLQIAPHCSDELFNQILNQVKP